MPILLKSGAEKGRILMSVAPVLGVLLALAVPSLLRSAFPDLKESVYGLGVLLAPFALFVGSVALSLRVYEKKDF